MADDITLEQGIEEQRAREAEFARIDRQQRVAANKYQRTVARQAQTNVTPNPLAEELQSDERKAWTSIWQKAHEIVEGIAFQFFLVGALLGGPLAGGLFLVRFFVGNGLHGGFEIERGDISLPAVPPMSTTELIYRSAKVGFIVLLSGLEWVILILLFRITTDPGFAAKLGLSVFGVSQ